MDSAKKESQRLAELIRTGEALEGKILDNAWLSIVLAGEAKDLYRLDLPGRVAAARTAREEVHRKLAGERDGFATELAFLDAQGVSAVPEDVAEVTRVLRECGFSDAQAAEHYLAAFKPDAAAALELVCRSPACFTGVFVSNADPAALAAIAAERRLRLRGPVVVSKATLDGRPDSTSEISGFVFRPFSAARFNKDAAAIERHELARALEAKEDELGTSRAQLETLQALVEDLRQLHERYASHRPQELRQDRDTLDQRVIELDHQSVLAGERALEIETERRQIKAARRIADAAVNDAKRWLRDVEQYAVRYSSIAADTARLPAATSARDQCESEATEARATAQTARRAESDARERTTKLRTQSANFRASKRHYPHTDGTRVEVPETLEDLIQQYRTAEHTLMSRRDAQQAHVSHRLADVRQDVLTLRDQSRTASENLTAEDIASFASVVDIDRAITEAEQSFEQRRDEFNRADHALKIAEAKSGPVIRMIREAEEKRNVKPTVLDDFVGAAAETCDAERDAREAQHRAAERDIRTFDSTKSRLADQQSELQGSLDDMKAVAVRIEDHLPDVHRSELPDLSMPAAEIKNVVGQLIRKLTAEAGTLAGLRQDCEELFDAVRSVFLADAFRQLEPQVAENLRSYMMRAACAERVFLQTRLAERIGVVQSEIDNQKRDQNACLEQLRQHVIHADDLLRRAMRCSRIPDHIPNFGGERILKIKRTLRDLSPDIVYHELNVWLDEQAISGRVPQDGAVLAAELLNRVHGGRPLDIEVLKPKRDAIQPYMRVERMGLSGGEGVTLAMMLYAVIQRMAMDERASSKVSPSGGFLMLDNTYGMSNMLDHVVLQMAMADMLGIQLFVTTCSEDKHVLNMYPTITRLVQGEVVSSNGVPQYIRVRAADYVLNAPDAA